MTDRRTARTRQALEDAFVALLREKHYDAIAIHEITDRANVGRSTFYLHYPSKLDLFLAVYQQPHLEPMASSTREVWLGTEPPATLVAFLAEIRQRGGHRALLPTFANSESAQLLGTLNRLQARQLEKNLRQAFGDEPARVPYEILAQTIAGLHVWLTGWWVDSRSPLTAHDMATMIQHLQRSILQDNFRADTG
jgi:AcrR family transcriptional regulator